MGEKQNLSSSSLSWAPHITDAGEGEGKTFRPSFSGSALTYVMLN